MRMHVFLIVIGLSLPLPGLSAVAVAAASSLRPLLEDVVRTYEKQHPQTIQISYGASGVLVQQILRGAPYQIFLTASDRFLEPLNKANKICGDPFSLGAGRLVLYLPKSSRLSLTSLEDLAKVLKNGTLKRLALANPETAPYGAMARQVLENLGVWTSAQSRMVFGESAAQAAQFALTGAVQAALLPALLVRGLPLASQGDVLQVPAKLYQPQRQAVALLCPHTPAATDFFQYLNQPAIAQRLQAK
ncbi:MAG: hypothetical protein AXA67_09465 [Methylothermaceae bacteria B42]|nr:MAG: hypothetical protein AXA67_09465 [Methylothermaceae bacteria B42]HHJ39532.1 molybdate ABC transporter substrate-binding protein [Methylothermaceae bacterium]